MRCYGTDMEPITVRLDSEELEQLDRELETRGFSNRAEYLRWIIRNRQSVEPTTADTLDDRLEDVEERLNRLEDELIDE